MKVLVTGGTGFVGREVVRQLIQSGHQLHLLVRPGSTGNVPTRSPSVKVFEGDLLENERLIDAAQGMEAIIHLVGIISEVGESTFQNIHAGGTEMILSAAKQTGIMRFIHMSSLGTRPQARSRYHQTKWAAEEAVRQSGLTFTIFRPSLIHGPGDLFVNRLNQIMRLSPVIPVFGSGRCQMQPIGVEEVAAAFVKALEEPQSIGKTFDLCGRERLTFNEILKIILEVTRRRRMLAHIPMELAFPIAQFLEIFCAYILRKAPPLNRDQLLMLQEDNVGDPDPAARLFNLPLKPFKEGICLYLNKRKGAEAE